MTSNRCCEQHHPGDLDATLHAEQLRGRAVLAFRVIEPTLPRREILRVVRTYTVVEGSTL